VSAAHISRSLRQAVIHDFRERCAYCRTAIAITGARMVIDHITAESAGGKTVRENICSAVTRTTNSKVRNPQAPILIQAKACLCFILDNKTGTSTFGGAKTASGLSALHPQAEPQSSHSI